MLIAHLSDSHILEEPKHVGSLLRRTKLRLLAVGRKLDFVESRQRLLAALNLAKRADHVVITGDLTEDGHPKQFESLARILNESGINPSRVTLVPGNHDAYVEEGAYEKALVTCLKAYHETSRLDTPLKLHGNLTLLPVSTAITQSIALARGALSLASVKAIASQARTGDLAALVMHHPPTLSLDQALMGLKGVNELRVTLTDNPNLHVFCGHTHVGFSRKVNATDRAERIHCVGAVIDAPTGTSPVRFYVANVGGLVPELGEATPCLGSDLPEITRSMSGT